ncbi:hypothetical protein RHMOL_Rhmol11G0075400 [Rhododendron molle]|uniref:Uncharacterized protein n=1 Tax=Rhododendron molle TaxID=49168 RepID=A0ACC0LQ27_RHOML|nr:hypothetical protein RHMOL_Rhmol11G0075400 [Rhododendron molle]
MRRLQKTRDRWRVLEQVLEEAPELSMVRYLDEKIQWYMAVESAADEGDSAVASAHAMGDQLVQDTTEGVGNMEQDGY